MTIPANLHVLSDCLISATHAKTLTRLSMREVALLAFLRRHAGAQLWGTRELAWALGVSKPSIVRSTSRLIVDKLLIMATREDDNRLRSFTLTEAGEAAVDAMVDAQIAKQMGLAA